MEQLYFYTSACRGFYNMFVNTFTQLFNECDMIRY